MVAIFGIYFQLRLFQSANFGETLDLDFLLALSLIYQYMFGTIIYFFSTELTPLSMWNGQTDLPIYIPAVDVSQPMNV